MSLILIDIDYFKLYNDNYGHLAGDKCLQTVAEALSEVIQRPADLVARYGGEEFGVILPSTDIEGAVQIAKSLEEKIASLELAHAYSKIGAHITLSMGITSRVACEGTKPAELIQLADQALYEAKASGRNRYRVAAEAT
jgi:diguanylate cyclase (GGDEF)-like protein